MQKWFGVIANIIRPVVDDCFFAEQILPRSFEIGVAFMPRKGANHIRLVAGLVGTKAHTGLPPISWLPIDNLQREQVAMRLRGAHIYLSTSVQEGLGLPPLEAMAAGCLVVGFAGGGGLDYATSANGIWLPDEDPWALADALLMTIQGCNFPRSRRTNRPIRTYFSSSTRQSVITPIRPSEFSCRN